MHHRTKFLTKYLESFIAGEKKTFYSVEQRVVVSVVLCVPVPILVLSVQFYKISMHTVEYHTT